MYRARGGAAAGAMPLNGQRALQLSLLVNLIVLALFYGGRQHTEQLIAKSFAGLSSCTLKYQAGVTKAAMEAPKLDPVYENVTNSHLRAVLAGCGKICRDDMQGEPSKFFNYIEKKPVNCQALLTNEEIDAARTTAEPEPKIPDDMLDFFTYGKRLTVQPWVLNAVYLGKEARTPVWTKEKIDDWAAQCKAGTLDGNYGRGPTGALWDAIKSLNLQGTKVLVIGSEDPWVEACALAGGAKHVTTLEYGTIKSLHPQVSSLTPAEMRANYKDYMETFDAVLTFSSVEHSGLGRYGDALNPWGDRQAIARAWCLTKPGGKLGITVPYDPNGELIYYNAHRVYGPIQYPHLVANWKQLDMFSNGETVITLEKV